MHAPYITEADITRSPALGGDRWTLSNLTTITALFGKNGSGKSLLLRAWRDSEPATSHYVVPERTGQLGYSPQYLEVQMNPIHRRNISQRNFIEEYRQPIIARIHGYFAARGNIRAGQLPGDPAELEESLSQLLPDFIVEISGTRTPFYRFVRASDNSAIQEIDQLSSGEAQLIMLALDILTVAAIWDIQGIEKRLMLVDEPDAHIHPDLQVRFADFLVQAAERYKLQAVVATHSTTLLAALGQFGGTSASVLYLDRTKVAFRAEPFSAVMKELAACLGGHALMGPLFSVPLLLVEGDDDYRICSQVPRHHAVTFAVIPSHGEEIRKYQRTLERLFAALREREQGLAGYALLDGDKAKPQVNPETPQDHIRYIQLACHESENLYLTDQVLALLGLTWGEASDRIVVRAETFGEKADLLRNAKVWDRKAVDVKRVINELSQILDDKRAHWTVRVARAIGVSRPEGQLVDRI
jgi:ABC-type Mn2+/Zn2+ transport system ATPase subunit